MAISATADDIAVVKENIGVQFPVYADPDRVVITAWGIADPDHDIAVPATFIVDKDGATVLHSVPLETQDRMAYRQDITALVDCMNSHTH